MEILRLREPCSCLEFSFTERSLKIRQTLAMLSKPTGTKQIGDELETENRNSLEAEL